MIRVAALLGCMGYCTAAFSQDLTDYRSWEEHEKRLAERLKELENKRDAIEAAREVDYQERGQRMASDAEKRFKERFRDNPRSLWSTAKAGKDTEKTAREVAKTIQEYNALADYLDGSVLDSTEAAIAQTKKDLKTSRQVISGLRANASKQMSLFESKPGNPSLLERLARALERERVRLEAEASAREREKESCGADCRTRVDHTERGRGQAGSKQTTPAKIEAPTRPQRIEQNRETEKKTEVDPYGPPVIITPRLHCPKHDPSCGD